MLPFIHLLHCPKLPLTEDNKRLPEFNGLFNICVIIASGFPVGTNALLLSMEQILKTLYPLISLRT